MRIYALYFGLSHFISVFFGYFCPIGLMRILAFPEKKSQQARTLCNWYKKVQTSKVVDKTHHSVFPFTFPPFGPTKYYGCTKDYTTPWAPYSWCATKTDDFGNMIDSAICDPGCPGVGKNSLKTC